MVQRLPVRVRFPGGYPACYRLQRVTDEIQLSDTKVLKQEVLEVKKKELRPGYV